MEIENINEEKQPFFSIEQEYNQERDQYIYTIYNTGGEVRYSDLQIMPILYVKQYGTDREIKNQAFKDMAGFYEYEITDDGLISFSDMWLDIAMLEEYSLGNNDSDKILGNDYLTGLTVLRTITKLPLAPGIPPLTNKRLRSASTFTTDKRCTVTL